MNITVIHFITFCLFLTRTLAQVKVQLAPVIDINVAQAGTDDVLARILGMESELKDEAGTDIEFEVMKQLKYDTLGELYVADSENVDNITGILTITKCPIVRQDEKISKRDFPWSVYLTVLDRGCPRPPLDIGIGVPFLKSVNDVLPLMVDMRSDTRLLYSWEDIVILYDSSIDINMLDIIVAMIQNTGTYKRATAITTFNVCLKNGCNDISSTVMDLLTPYAVMEFPKHFFIIASPSSGRKIFIQAKKLNILDSDRRWLFLTPEVDNGEDLMMIAKDIPPEANVAIVYKDRLQVPESTCFSSLELDGCHMTELLRTFARSTRQLVENKQYDVSTTSNRAITKRRIIDTMLNMLDKTMTCGGCVKFILKTTAYLRPDFVSTITTIDDYETVGEWTAFQGLKMYGDLYPLTTGNFRGKPLKIGIINEPPGAKIVEDPTTKERSYSGMVVDFVDEMAKEMNFTYKFVVPEDKQSGRRVNNVWTGMIGQIERKEVDFAAQLFFMTRERMEVVNFTVSLDESAYALFLLRPHQEHKYLFLAPFTYDTWLGVFITLVIIGPVLFLVHRASVYYEYHDLVNDKGLFRFSNCVWYCYGAIVQQGGVHLPVALSGRVLVGFWWIFVIVTVTTYSGNLVAVLTFPKIRIPVNTFADMISHKGEFKWGIFEGEALLENFRTSDKGEMFEMNQGLTVYKKDMERTLLDEIVREELVFIDTRSHLLEMLSAEHNRTTECMYSIGTVDVVAEPVSIAVPKNWPYLEKMNTEISRLVESGIFIKWRKRSLPPDNECTTNSKPQAGDIRKINVSQMMGAFFILGFGFAGAAIALFGEYMHLKFKNEGDAPATFKHYLKNNFRFWAKAKVPVAPGSEKSKKFMESKVIPDLKDPHRRKKKRKGIKQGKALRGIENDGYTREYWDSSRDMEKAQYSDRENDIYSTYEDYNPPAYRDSYDIKRDYENVDTTRQSSDNWFSSQRDRRSTDQYDSQRQGTEDTNRRRPRDRRSYFSYDHDNPPRY